MKRILIVDDEPIILVALSHLLSNEETLVITSSRIEDAEEALDKYKFDLVIADIRLSGVDGIEGIELLSYIKRITPDTAVIIMTAYGSEQMRGMAKERGAYHYFEKPIDNDELIDLVKDLDISVSAGK